MLQDSGRYRVIACHSQEIGNILGEIPCEPLKNIAIPCEPLEKFSGLQRHCSNFFFALHATAVRLGPNGVKLQVWKVENTLKSKYVINFFEHLNDFKWKNSKLESCRSRRDLYFSYKNYLYFIPQKKYDLIWLIYLKKIISFFTELNENNFYMKIIDLDEIYNFLILSFFIWSR